MTDPTPFERELGRALRSAFGLETKVVRFADDDGAYNCFIVSGQDCPAIGVSSYASVGLSSRDQRAGTEVVNVEVVAACASATPYVDNLVASCVFESVKNGANITYGAHIENILVQYGISKTLKHVAFVAPFPWRGLGNFTVDGQSVHCLLMLPISDAEKDHLVEFGIDALENLFNEKQIDIFDIQRPSVIS
ncbi:suppressor of fused domain protein [Pseudomonas mangrovi]|uniref:Suppressor of fused-like domain-containing protein n=1 Tax=Pseudomonas mangrovi TaxID=2161748 RepID=A0A2T5P6T2_9PSED|nr:suppressor of fused domain protein [Pseudomonas mangrovi]PTU73462.1 hypothetical protein DBO85_14135 [Pseudomonas mangrovi]